MARHRRRILTRRHEAEAGLADPQAAEAAASEAEEAEQAAREVEADPAAVAAASEAEEVGPSVRVWSRASRHRREEAGR